MADTVPPFPWLQVVWDRLQQAHGAGRLPHALLFAGAAGLGKRALADALAGSLFCESPGASGAPCGQCRGCQLFQAGTHPDFRIIEPEEEGKAIKIDAIRAFTGNEGLTAHACGYKISLIEPADAMNQAAANALLKTLEEPTSWTLIILISTRPTHLAATIRSRCQRIDFTIPEQGMALEWLGGQAGNADPKLLLQLATGTPLRARELAREEALGQRLQMLDEFMAVLEGKQDPVVVAGRWQKLGLPRVLHWMCGWVIDMLRLKMAAQPPNIINLDQRKRLQAVAGRLDLQGLYRVLDRIYEANSTLDAPLNVQMLLEDLLLASTEVGQPQSKAR